MPKIRVHEKALGHLTKGLYRSPASALRELVSNAWDANARSVHINTNAPNFFQISIEDNGDGFKRQDFERLMGEGIGNSLKRADEVKLINARPVIGRLGIGMLGIAQICGGFSITSTPKSGEGFKARIKLYDLLKEKLDADDVAIVREEDQQITEVNVGEYSFEEYSKSGRKSGTIIIADQVHPTFTNAFQQSLKFEKYKDPPLDWRKALRITKSVHSLQELGDYWRLLWELAASCPVPYVAKNALPEGLITDEQKRLEKYDFSVIVDGITLFKPVYLHGNPGGYTSIKIPSHTQRIYGRDLQYHGYIIVQDGKQISPDELRGICIRIKNIGIGYYDPSLLDYRFNEGPRNRWITGEIFVDAGLENALNVDRDSFNRFHPEFRALQLHIHKLLREEIFPGVYKNIAVRSTARERSRVTTRTQQLRAVVSQALHKPAVIKTVSTSSASGSSGDTDVSIAIGRKKVEVEVPPSEGLKVKRSNQQLASSILTVFEIAMREKSLEKQRAKFKELLVNLLAKW